MNELFEYIKVAIYVTWLTIGCGVSVRYVYLKASELLVSMYISRMYKKIEPDKKFKVEAKYISHKNYSIKIKEVN
ncbi:hypothetical protein [Paraglaciecola chathamensis]|uniref:hypothetical protein n=1 Tax=Paraglaciecola chathamensis TaxID=368405 RepID=UPI003643F048